MVKDVQHRGDWFLETAAFLDTIIRGPERRKKQSDEPKLVSFIMMFSVHIKGSSSIWVVISMILP